MNDPADSPSQPTPDPRRIRSLVVHTDDVLTALEAHERKRKPVVLRVTPPFAGQMRARLHVTSGEGHYEDHEQPLHLSPQTFIADVPPFPDVDDTEDRLRERGEYSVERHREEHARAVARWRAHVREQRKASVSLDSPDGSHDVRVAYLG